MSESRRQSDEFGSSESIMFRMLKSAYSSVSQDDDVESGGSSSRGSSITSGGKGSCSEQCQESKIDCKYAKRSKKSSTAKRLSEEEITHRIRQSIWPRRDDATFLNLLNTYPEALNKKAGRLEDTLLHR